MILNAIREDKNLQVNYHYHYHKEYDIIRK